MATRPIFSPLLGSASGVNEMMMEFQWHPGMAVVQKQKSIRELHTTAKAHGFDRVLEISSKSEQDLGVKLSAFNLCITTRKKGNKFTVETAFQGSKVFENGGPYKDLIGMDSRAAKKDVRLKESGNIIGFEFFGQKFPNKPRTFFYDWLYINALTQNTDLAEALLDYSGFSDIEFNPKKSINCQAYSVALYISLKKNNQLEQALSSPEEFLKITEDQYKKQLRNIQVQSSFI